MDGFVQSPFRDTMPALPATSPDSSLRRVGRVAAYVGCLGAVVALVFVGKSRAVDAREPARAESQGSSSSGQGTKVDLNGLALGFRHEVREGTEAQALTAAARACEAKGLRPVVVGGTVHCAQSADTEMDPTRIAAGEHSEATSLPAGGTRIVSLDVERRASLSELLPSDGDAPGSDSVAVPRPASSRRIMSGGSAGTGGVFVYETHREAAAVADELTKAMTARGCSRAQDMDDATIGFLRGHEVHMIRLTKGEGGVLLVTVVEGLGIAAQPSKVAR